MNLHVNSRGQVDHGIVYQRGLMQFWVPSNMQPHLPYNPRHVPVIIPKLCEDEGCPHHGIPHVCV